MTPTIIAVQEKKLLGSCLPMSLAADKTIDLWKNFMPLRKQITNNLGSDLYSLRIYDKNYNFQTIDLEQEFFKWAAMEVSSFSDIPDGLHPLHLNGGLYAVFNYKGLSTNTEIFKNIYADWLPNSIYDLDDRPHFEILGEKYKNNDPKSEETIWIPVKGNVWG